MIDRRTFSKKALVATLGLAGGAVLGSMPGVGLISSSKAATALKEPVVGDDGMYTQPWFNHTSFLDLAEDTAEAAQNGRRLAILFEQKGCPYCREMHRVNFAIPEIADYIKQNFVVLQLNLWGDREVTDFAGDAMSEKKFAKKNRVMFTPTIMFPDARGDEAFRMPGYFKPFHFKHMFMYVKEEAYLTEPNFQRWLQGKADELRAAGKDVNLWD